MDFFYHKGIDTNAAGCEGLLRLQNIQMYIVEV